ncbi:MAG: hypothetical protein JXA42_17690 [Anaerolineales bacterium]|nr:hypothetical protein [Anaerolineales bacterium]
MSKKIDHRIPNEIGKGALPDHPAVKSPWEKLISFRDAFHFAVRHNAVMDANMMQVLRILVPDYETRAKLLCENARDVYYGMYKSPFGPVAAAEQNIHPFMMGNFMAGLVGDHGDEALLMCGRVNDFGTYRLEKELDICDWDIVGSDFCRTTVVSLQHIGTGMSECIGQAGPNLDYHFTEQRGCGHLHCRIVAEDRDKYPMPEHEIWESLGPVATADQIKFTPEEEMLTEPQFFMEECDYKYCGGTCAEKDAAAAYLTRANVSLSPFYFGALFGRLIKQGECEEAFLDNVIKCVFEASGKTAFGDFYAKKGLRDWLGVPNDIEDGRVLGAYLEVVCQMTLVDYEVEAFNKDEVIYRLNRTRLNRRMPKLANAYLSMWFGMCKTLIGAQWALWEEKGDSPDDIIRIKIAKKVDQFC